MHNLGQLRTVTKMFKKTVTENTICSANLSNWPKHLLHVGKKYCASIVRAKLFFDNPILGELEF